MSICRSIWGTTSRVYTLARLTSSSCVSPNLFGLSKLKDTEIRRTHWGNVADCSQMCSERRELKGAWWATLNWLFIKVGESCCSPNPMPHCDPGGVRVRATRLVVGCAIKMSHKFRTGRSFKYTSSGRSSKVTPNDPLGVDSWVWVTFDGSCTRTDFSTIVKWI